MPKQQARFKPIPVIAGLIVVLLLAGFSLGLRTVMEIDPANAQLRTTKYALKIIPVSSSSEMLWITTADMAYNKPDWKLMHEFHRSAMGTKIEHTKWGAVGDTVPPWNLLAIESAAKAQLASRTLDLIKSDHPIRSIRVYILRVDATLRYRLGLEAPTLTEQDINTIFNEAIAKPIEG